MNVLGWGYCEADIFDNYILLHKAWNNFKMRQSDQVRAIDILSEVKYSLS